MGGSAERGRGALAGKVTLRSFDNDKVGAVRLKVRTRAPGFRQAGSNGEGRRATDDEPQAQRGALPFSAYRSSVWRE